MTEIIINVPNIFCYKIVHFKSDTIKRKSIKHTDMAFTFIEDVFIKNALILKHKEYSKFNKNIKTLAKNNKCIIIIINDTELQYWYHQCFNNYIDNYFETLYNISHSQYPYQYRYPYNGFEVTLCKVCSYANFTCYETCDYCQKRIISYKSKKYNQHLCIITQLTLINDIIYLIKNLFVYI
jgi:hypothetical protein